MVARLSWSRTEDADDALTAARKIGQAYTLMQALVHVECAHLYCGNSTKAKALSDELVALSDEKGAWYHKIFATLGQGHLPPVAGHASDTVQMLTAAIAAYSRREERQQPCH